jgi:hypothetical protein
LAKKELDLSIAIPYHGDRSKWTMQTIMNNHNRDFVREIVITVEAGNESEVIKLQRLTKNYPKVVIHENDQRLFVFRNKIRAVSLCKSDWVALIDSDNVIGSIYLGPILRKAINNGLSESTVYCPEIGFTKLFYTKFVGIDINLYEATNLIGDPQYDMLINTMNYVFHRETWLNALSDAISSNYEPMTADSAWINFNCMKNGMILNVLKGSTYKHTVHNQSTYALFPQDGATEYAKICATMKGLLDENLGSSRKIQAGKSNYISSTSDWSAIGGQGRNLLRKEQGSDKDRSGLLTD